MMKLNIAIDGPSAAGKSTVAKAIAQERGLLYLDTGALYRVVGLAVLRKGIDPTCEEAVQEILPELQVTLGYQDGTQRVYLNGEDVSEDIRLPEMSMAASRVSAHKGVRGFLLDLQRSLARDGGVVMDGRDIGTVVLPDAPVKIFLTATAEERAKRRMAEFQLKGHQVDFECLLAEIKQRDENDSKRKEAPLSKAEDAILLDSTHMSLSEVIVSINQMIDKRAR